MTDRADKIAREIAMTYRQEIQIAAALRDFAKAERERTDSLAAENAALNTVLDAYRQQVQDFEQSIQRGLARMERAENLLGKFAHFRFGHDANCSTDEQKRKAYQEAADFLGLDEIRAPWCAAGREAK